MPAAAVRNQTSDENQPRQQHERIRRLLRLFAEEEALQRRLDELRRQIDDELTGRRP